jgi:hypothetical protein
MSLGNLFHGTVEWGIHVFVDYAEQINVSGPVKPSVGDYRDKNIS